MLTKQAIDVSFAQGLDTKTDPKRVQIGKFVKLENTVFDKAGLLQKRNGYAQLSSLPSTSYSYLTTLNDNLTAIGQNIAAYNQASNAWVSKGQLQPLSLNTLPIVRNNLNQTAADSAIAPNGLICTAYLENNNGTVTNKFLISNSTTGQNIVAPLAIPVASGTVSGGMRVFYLGTNFVIVFTNTISGTAHLQYITVNAYSNVISANADLAASYVPASTLSWDCAVVNNKLYFAYDTTSGGQSIKLGYLTSGGVVVAGISFTGFKATMVSLSADNSNPSAPILYLLFYRSDTSAGYATAVDQNLNVQPGFVAGPVQILSVLAIANLTAAAQNGTCTFFVEIVSSYNFNTNIACNYINTGTITINGVAPGESTSILGLGLASKAFIVNEVIYYLAAYSFPYSSGAQANYQPTYFLINGSESSSSAPVISAKLAYENGGGYLMTGLPNVTVIGATAYVNYLYKDLIAAVSKSTSAAATGQQTAGVYSQTGVNLCSFTFGTSNLDTAEIANCLQVTGGFLGLYDGYLPVEHNFFLWPDTDQISPTNTASWSTTGGSVHAQPDGTTNANAYYVQFTYEWTDNQGNAYRSAPSIPIAITTTGSGTTGSFTYNVPTLRATMKTANPVKICAYRWSVGQQIYYQTTSIISPILNNTNANYLTITDTNSDATILGNAILYTTGGVVEDVNAPASDVITLFDTRLWLVDAEDRNLLWYSKQVIEATPVEMSDLFTIYVPPSTSTQGTTGPIASLQPMDDKLIIGKANALFYINGTGPDNTGANSAYSPATFITSSVGCANQNSWVLTPVGLMFQSDKGIWLLSRGLETSYIGAPVEDLVTGNTVLSAVNVPETNQVRFTLSSGVTLMYDYYYDQWGSFTNVPAVSSCVFQGLHTFINSYGAVYQESPGLYVDGSSPVLIGFQTGPLRLGDLQNYQRAYFFYILGEYISPHKLFLSITYDYENASSQSVLISPDNYSTPFGSGPSQSPFGQQTRFGGNSSLELWRIFLDRQRCMAISITLQEIYDASFGIAAGAGLTLSGLNIICGFKQKFRPQSAANSIG